MRLRLSCLIAAASVATLVGCSQPEPCGVLEFRQTGTAAASHDFGALPPSPEDAHGEVWLRNSGTCTVSLTSIEPISGAPISTSPSTAETSWVFQVVANIPEVAPGRDVRLALRYRPSITEREEQRAQVRVRTTAGTTLDLTLTGTPQPSGCFEGTTLKFGTVPLKGATTRTFVVENKFAVRAPLLLGAFVESGPAGYELPPGPTTFWLEPGEQKEVAITLRPAETKAYFSSLNVTLGICPTRRLLLEGEGGPAEITWSPAIVEYGFVLPPERPTRTITFYNPRGESIRLAPFTGIDGQDFFIVGNTEPGLLVGPAAQNDAGELVPGSANVEVGCTPTSLGLREATLQYGIGSIPLRCVAGRPDIELSPSQSLTFDKVAYFASANPPLTQSRTLRIRNVGRQLAGDAEANLRFEGGLSAFSISPLNPQTGASEFSVSLGSTMELQTGLEATTGKNELALEVRFTPSSPGLKQAELAIHSNDPDEPTIKVALAAEAVVLPPCNFTLTPSNLDFEFVPYGTSRSMSLQFKNEGTSATDLCLVAPPFFQGPAAELFSTPMLTVREVDPGEVLEIPIQLDSAGATTLEVNATARVQVSTPTKGGQVDVTLEGSAGPHCLKVYHSGDLGAAKLGCSTSPATATFFNACPYNVTIHSFAMSDPAGLPPGVPGCAGPLACPEFQITAPYLPANGLTVSQGQHVNAPLKYTPLDSGTDDGELSVEVTQPQGAGTKVRYRFPLTAEGSATGMVQEQFSLPSTRKLDVLFVIEQNFSFMDEQTVLATATSGFLQAAQTAGVDLRIAVASANPPSADFGTLVTGLAHPDAILDSSTANLSTQLAEKVKVGDKGLSGINHLLEVAKRATQTPGFLRHEAALAVVLVSDEADTSPSATTHYLNELMHRKQLRASHLTVSATGGGSYACQINSPAVGWAVSMSDGVFAEICSLDWLQFLKDVLALESRTRELFPLSSPWDSQAGPLSISVNGTPVQPLPSGNLTWQYDSWRDAVQFHSPWAPQPGDTVTFDYAVGCY